MSPLQFGVFCNESQAIKCLNSACAQMSPRRDFCEPLAIDCDAWLGAKCPKCEAPQWQARIEHLKSEESMEETKKLLETALKGLQFPLKIDPTALQSFIHMSCDSRAEADTVLQNNAGFMMSVLAQLCACILIKRSETHAGVCELLDSLANFSVELFESERRDALRRDGIVGGKEGRKWHFALTAMGSAILLHQLCQCQSAEDVATAKAAMERVKLSMTAFFKGSRTKTSEYIQALTDIIGCVSPEELREVEPVLKTVRSVAAVIESADDSDHRTTLEGDIRKVLEVATDRSADESREEHIVKSLVQGFKLFGHF